MKNSKLLLLLALLIVACSKDQEPAIMANGEVSFGILTVSEDLSGRTSGDRSEASAVLISIEDASGNPFFDLERLELIAVGDTYVTRKVQMPAGNYYIKKFMVVNEENEAIYITPMEGSEKAKFVHSPLPHEIIVVPDGVVSMPIEVLEVNEGSQPGDFGLIEFPINFTEQIEVEVSVLQNNAPVGASLEVQGRVDGFIRWDMDIDLQTRASSLKLYDNVDSIVFSVISPENAEVKYSLEDLKADPVVIIALGNNDLQDFVVEVAGVTRTFEKAVATLENQSGIFKASFEGDPDNQRMLANFKGVPMGEYEVTLSIFEERFFEDSDPAARGSFFPWNGDNRSLNSVSEPTPVIDRWP